jgi:hypothetical protein
MFTVTMKKLFRSDAATSNSTKHHDDKSETLTETQRQQILKQNRRKLNSFLGEKNATEYKFSQSNIELSIEVPSDDIEMLYITCKLMTLDAFDNHATLRRKCRRMNKKHLSGVVLLMEKQNPDIELFYTTPMESLTLELFEHVLGLLEMVALDCYFDLQEVRFPLWRFAFL